MGSVLFYSHFVVMCTKYDVTTSPVVAYSAAWGVPESLRSSSEPEVSALRTTLPFSAGKGVEKEQETKRSVFPRKFSRCCSFSLCVI